MNASITGTYFGKYREIVLAVAFFLVFDLAVLILNFYISFQIADSAVAINLAGRQRMLSQRMTKALLTLESDRAAGVSGTDGIAELRSTADLFDQTLSGFRSGATVRGGDDRPVFLAAVSTPAAKEILDQAETVWNRYQDLLQPLLAGSTYTPAQLDTAVRYARDNNLALLALMNRLTTQLEQAANARADTLRRVQTGGILLALANFVFILFKFVRRLNEYDRKTEAAQKETAEILGTVNEGLFLLDAEYRIGSQCSASLAKVLGRPVQPGQDFRGVLREMVSAAAFESACDYISLLLDDWVRESLVTSLNPLTAVQVTDPGANGVPSRRYLTLQFNRVIEQGKVAHLLVTVTDVSVQVELEQALADAKKKAKAEVEVMLDILKVDPTALDQYLDRAERTLLEINDRLRCIDGAGDYRNAIAAIFRQVHALKGEAGMLGLEMFEDLAHHFESLLAGLRAKGAVTGDDLIALPLPLDDFLQRIAVVRDLAKRVSVYHNTFGDPGSFGERIAALAQRIAKDEGKAVQVVAELELMSSLPPATRDELGAIAVQLLRNAVVHGIETMPERSARQKSPEGSIYMGLKAIENGELEFVLRDDGRGLLPQRIRTALLQSGRYTETQLNELDERELLLKIFEPGISTAGAVTRDAGQGVGLDIVKQKILRLGARLRVSTRENVYTAFSLRFAV